MCSCSGGGGGADISYTTTQLNSVQQNTIMQTSADCNITRPMLTTWKAAVGGLKADGKLSVINLNEASANIILGVTQSALNYPDNYCYYQPQLQYFKDVILPKIAQYVPEYLN